jgi:hypothetical protein
MAPASQSATTYQRGSRNSYTLRAPRLRCSRAMTTAEPGRQDHRFTVHTCRQHCTAVIEQHIDSSGTDVSSTADSRSMPGGSAAAAVLCGQVASTARLCGDPALLDSAIQSCSITHSRGKLCHVKSSTESSSSVRQQYHVHAAVQAGKHGKP